MESGQSFFYRNFSYMLEQLGTTPYEICDSYQAFLNNQSPRGHTRRFQFNKNCQLPNRSTLSKYLKNEDFTPKRSIVTSIVEFYNINLHQKVSVDDFLNKELRQMQNSDPELRFLAGDYYVLFPDPSGEEKQLRGGYLHLKNNGSEDHPIISAHMIADICDESLLFGFRPNKVFQTEDYKGNFEKFRKSLTDLQRSGCRYYEGNVHLDDHVVTFDFRGENDKKTWYMKLNFEKMIDHINAQTNRTPTVKYKGGLLCALVSNDKTDGTYVTKMGLAAMELYRNKLRLNDNRIMEQLQFSGERNAYFVDQRQDNRWYQMLLALKDEKDVRNQAEN